MLTCAWGMGTLRPSETSPIEGVVPRYALFTEARSRTMTSLKTCGTLGPSKTTHSMRTQQPYQLSPGFSSEHPKPRPELGHSCAALRCPTPIPHVMVENVSALPARDTSSVPPSHSYEWPPALRHGWCFNLRESLRNNIPLQALAFIHNANTRFSL